MIGALTSAVADAPFTSPDRPPPKFRPIKAFGHYRKLVENGEDTAQVFYMAECLPSKRSLKVARHFCESDEGKALMETEPHLAALLDDHDTLLAMPEGSVAHAYVDFMRREKLSAAGLVEASTFPGQTRYQDSLQWLMDRFRDIHDLAHILTGYGRDGLGEQCVLSFTNAQYHDWTEWFIAWVGVLEFAQRVKSDAPVFKAVAEAHRHGKAADKLYKQNISKLLAEPLDDARARLGIGPPTLYEHSHERMRACGIDPYSLAMSQP